MITIETKRSKLKTPLRYPGGKSSLYRFLESVIKGHEWYNVEYIEPFAGGAGAAVSLLLLEKVRSIVVNDLDPAIYAFWYSVVNDNERFIRLVELTPVCIEEWEKQKAIYKACDPSDLLALGFATFFLNRTNRSGILNAGVIGGKQQLGKWKIDARYNKNDLIEKAKLIGLYRDRITVLNKDGSDIINDYANIENSFFYIDPPYFDKGSFLYLNAFKPKDHDKLAEVLRNNRNAKWILSYDNARYIRDLYEGFNNQVFNLRYSAHHDSKSGSEIMIFSEAVDMGVVDSIC